MGQPPSPPRSACLRGTYVTQADHLCRILYGLKQTATGHRRNGHDVRTIVAIEDFVLIRFESSERQGLDPVRVTSAFISILEERELNRDIEIVYQSPANAKAYATNDRLRHWGVWEIGAEEHERDAMRHMLLAITSSPRTPRGEAR
jgi:hypothetical protein